MINFRDKVNFIWSVADLLRGDYRQADYGKVILPMTVLRRLDCVLEPTKEQVLAKVKQMEGGRVTNLESILQRITGQPFHNTSRLTFQSLLGDPALIAVNLTAYINGFSERAREVVDRFRFEEQIGHLDRSNLLYKVVQRFAAIDLHPDVVSNHEMGYIFEELIRRFSEQANETAGEHFTPREVIRLMVDLLFYEDRDGLTKPGIVRTLYDPACGTGGMLSVGEEYLLELNPDGRLEVFGQELNPESFAICNADMMIKGQNPDHIKFGNSFTQDGLADEKFDYMLCNPPFGVEWKKVQEPIEEEHEKKGYAGRFGAGLPRINDGSFLFLQHMISKMKPGGSRIAIVFNGSPLFTGSVDSGESRIRRWIIENDWLEAIVALPTELFYNTGIATYVWIVTSRKSPRRKGRVQLVNGVGFSRKMRKALGNKRNFITDEQIAEITRLYGEFAEGEHCKVFDNEDFGYRRITVERPLKLSFQVSPERLERLRGERAFASLAESKKRDEEARKREEAEGRARQEEILTVLRGMDGGVLYRSRPEFEKVLGLAFKKRGMALAAPLKKAILSGLSERDESAEVCLDVRGNPEPDPELRDYENVPLMEDVHAYFEREVLPHVPDAWIDEPKTKIGYEIPFTRHFYKYQEIRPLEEIDAEIRALEFEIQEMLMEVMA
jgi:type I restriction enzyme M protein